MGVPAHESTAAERLIPTGSRLTSLYQSLYSGSGARSKDSKGKQLVRWYCQLPPRLVGVPRREPLGDRTPAQPLALPLAHPRQDGALGLSGTSARPSAR
jgi:hypothetical protein